MTYSIGQTIQVSTTIVDPATDLPVDPSTIRVEVRQPDGTIDTNVDVPTRDSAGSYHVDYLPVQVGHYGYRFVTEGVAAGIVEGSFDVTPAYSVLSVVSLEEIHAALNYPAGPSDDDPEIVDVIAAAVQFAEFYVGPVAPRTVADWLEPGFRRARLVLPSWPVISVTSIADVDCGVPSSIPLDPATFVLDGSRGRLTRIDGYPFTTPTVVTYVAGRTQVPPAVKEAVKEFVAYRWQASQQGSRTSLTGGGAILGEDGDLGAQLGADMGVPYRVMNLLAPLAQSRQG